MRVTMLVVLAVLAAGCSREAPPRDQPAVPAVPVYNVVISGTTNTQPIAAVKGIRAVTGLGLAEAMAVFEDMPSTLFTNLTLDVAEVIAEKLTSCTLQVAIEDR